ncbi:MAG: glycosyltransferase family 2 protein [Mariniphaga sp.]|nr:glycosyltransferase family 2 protein [Mariniphaga sp.]
MLPIVDELIVVVGDSNDGTREAIVNLKNLKIKIVDSVWDENLRKNGKIFAQQSDIGLNQVSGDWAFHLQIDEVLHENAGEIIFKAIRKADSNKNIDGLLFPFLHFWGDYNHIRNTRRTHQYEIRAFKNTGDIRAYKDSQGFRDFSKKPRGEKLRVIKTDTPIYHYSYARHPQLMKKKDNYFHRFWHNDSWLKENINESEFNYNEVDKLEVFTEEHPVFMTEIIKRKDWDFRYDPSQSNMKFKDRILNGVEKATGKRLFEYRNYRLVNEK